MTNSADSGLAEKFKHFVQGSLLLPKNRLIQLDVVQCIAILLAIDWHFNNITVGILPIDWLIAPGRQIGWAGVDLFLYSPDF